MLQGGIHCAEHLQLQMTVCAECCVEVLVEWRSESLHQNVRNESNNNP